MKEPTPGFFVKIRMIGVTLAAISAAILAIPTPLPAIVVTLAGYLAVAGTVAGAVSQAAVKNEQQ
jgi:ABC-type xylose transport system permease subunit